MSYLTTALASGIAELFDYLSAHVLTCIIPAFFIAGGITVFISSGAVLKYFGAKAKRYVAYSVASVSGIILAVCSCTILPLFAGIYKRGAGLGPAVTFLYAGPAINLLAIVLTARAIGLEMGVGRALGAIIFSIVTGLIMAFLFKKEEEERLEEAATLEEGLNFTGLQLITFFGLLVAVLLFGTANITFGIKAAIIIFLITAIYYVSKKWFEPEDIQDWMYETWELFKKLFPILLVGVFIAGMLKVIVPETWVTAAVGGNSLVSNLVGSVFGAFFYFSTLTEVPIVKALVDLGMGKGPALALLLAGPAVSLPNMLVIRSVIGTKKTVTYVSLVIIMATIAGKIFGTVV